MRRRVHCGYSPAKRESFFGWRLHTIDTTGAGLLEAGDTRGLEPVDLMRHAGELGDVSEQAGYQLQLANSAPP